MQLAAGGSNRNQDEKIVLLSTTQMNRLQMGLAILGTGATTPPQNFQINQPEPWA